MSLFPAGDLRTLVIHWTASDYRTTFPAYHVCVGLDAAGRPAVFDTHDLRANMRDVRREGPPYAAHTHGRNSYAIGLAICAMAHATPQDFGAFALREDLVALACATAARLCAFYAIAVERASVYTHAEAALEDGYYGSGEDERWDVARLRAAPGPLEAWEAAAVGDELRARVRDAVAGSRDDA